MAEIRIPEQAKQGLLAVQKLNDDQFQALAKAFGEETPSLDVEDAQNRIANKVTEIDKDQLDDILYAVIGLYLSSSSIKDDSEVLIREIASSPDLNLDQSEQDDLKLRLLQLSTSDSLLVTAKARQVQTEYEHIYLSSHAVTDVRPIFKKDLQQPPNDVVVTHSFKFVYRKNKKNRHFFLALASKDLEELKKVVERAIQKEESVKNLLRKADVNCLED